MTTVEIGPRLWTVQDVADYLGVPVRTLYDWRCRDYGPRARKVGRYLRYESSEVQRWFDSLDGQAA
jgi:excisionase family DNA binding protein